MRTHSSTRDGRAKALTAAPPSRPRCKALRTSHRTTKAADHRLWLEGRSRTPGATRSTREDRASAHSNCASNSPAVDARTGRVLKYVAQRPQSHRAGLNDRRTRALHVEGTRNMSAHYKRADRTHVAN